MLRLGCPGWRVPQLGLMLEVSGKLAWRTGGLTGRVNGGLQPTEGETRMDHLSEILLQSQLLFLLNQSPGQGLSWWAEQPGHRERATLGWYDGQKEPCRVLCEAFFLTTSGTPAAESVCFCPSMSTVQCIWNQGRLTAGKLCALETLCWC